MTSLVRWISFLSMIILGKDRYFFTDFDFFFSNYANLERPLYDTRCRWCFRGSESLRRRCLFVHVSALASGAFDADFTKVKIDEHVSRRFCGRPFVLHASLFDSGVLLRPQDNSGSYSNRIRSSNAVKLGPVYFELPSRLPSLQQRWSALLPRCFSSFNFIDVISYHYSHFEKQSSLLGRYGRWPTPRVEDRLPSSSNGSPNNSRLFYW